MTSLLPLIWAGIIAFGVILYVILDGFDLGIGLMLPFFESKADRDTLMSVILPVWDGNETWLVFGGACLYGAFPYAFSLLMPALYLPIFMMVTGLLFRGVSLEFRLKSAPDKKNYWDEGFFIGSLLATLSQGLILGAFVKGFHFTANTISLTPYQWFNPFSVFCAIALVFGYVLLGANRLIIKTEGHCQKVSYKVSSSIQFIILAAVIIVSIWSPLLDTYIEKRWFDPRYMKYLALFPLTSFFLFALHYVALKKRWERVPFWSSIGIFILCYGGFIISCYPYVVPRVVVYLDAAAPLQTLRFMFIGAMIMLPPLLYYTYYSYKIFSGKVTQKLGY